MQVGARAQIDGEIRTSRLSREINRARVADAHHNFDFIPDHRVPLRAMSSTDVAWHTVTIRIPFASERHAAIAKQVIEVDKELQPQDVKRDLSVDGGTLIATFSTLTVRLSRLTVNAFLENVDLVVRTIGEFGENAENGAAS